MTWSRAPETESRWWSGSAKVTDFVVESLLEAVPSPHEWFVNSLVVGDWADPGAPCTILPCDCDVLGWESATVFLMLLTVEEPAVMTVALESVFDDERGDSSGGESAMLLVAMASMQCQKSGLNMNECDDAVVCDSRRDRKDLMCCGDTRGA